MNLIGKFVAYWYNWNNKAFKQHLFITIRIFLSYFWTPTNWLYMVLYMVGRPMLGSTCNVPPIRILHGDPTFDSIRCTVAIMDSNIFPEFCKFLSTYWLKSRLAKFYLVTYCGLTGNSKKQMAHGNSLLILVVTCRLSF